LLSTNFGEYTFAKISAHVSAQEITAYLMVGLDKFADTRSAP
jgi:hypothetical protein